MLDARESHVAACAGRFDAESTCSFSPDDLDCSPSSASLPGVRRAVLSTMDIPTPRELELETLLRQRDAQVAQLTVRIVCVHPIPTYSTHISRRVLG